jgi:hypothetical protein
MSVEASLSIGSKSHCDTTISRDNELFWTEEFIVPTGCVDHRIMSALPPIALQNSAVLCGWGLSVLIVGSSHAPV